MLRRGNKIQLLMTTLLLGGGFLSASASARETFQIQDPAGFTITCDYSGLGVPESTARVSISGSRPQNSTFITASPSFGGIATSLWLTGANGQSINIVEGHSAGGAGWQTSFFGLDPSTNRIYVFNQGAGNSDEQWGISGAMKELSLTEWIPIYSDHYHDGPTFDAPSIATTPCPRLNNSVLVSDGLNQILTSTRKLPNGEVIPSIENRFTLRARIPQQWSWWQAEQAMYLGLKEAVQNDLRVVFIGKNKAWTKTIRPTTYQGFGADPYQQGGCRNEKNCWLHSADVDAVLLIYSVGGEDLAVAIHRPSSLPFQVELNIQDSPYGCPELGNPVCGNVNIHFWQAPDAFNPQPLSLAVGETQTYSMTYEVGRLADLLSEPSYQPEPAK